MDPTFEVIDPDKFPDVDRIRTDVAAFLIVGPPQPEGAMKSAADLLADGVTWVLETEDVRTHLHIPTEATFVEALDYATRVWATHWPEDHKPEWYTCLPTSDIDVWVVEAFAHDGDDDCWTCVVRKVK